MDLATCANKFYSLSNWQEYGEYRSDTGLPGVQKVITLHGCRALCGNGTDTYDWNSIANSIATWVFPMIGILLQAPFESNNTEGTILLLLRWLGSPIAALSYILWNIKVSGRAALVVDMAVQYDEYPDIGSKFSEIRDSFYILTVMNQYTINRKMHTISYGPDVAEKLLRATLFDDHLVVNGEKLPRLRERTASNLRQSRKQGVVAVFISMGWFLFSLAISIQAVFSNIGPIEQSDNLGLGLMLAWIPVLILSSIVDRNPANSSSVEDSLNQLVSGVKNELCNPTPQHRQRLGSVSTPPQSPIVQLDRRNTMTASLISEKADWIGALEDDAFKGKFFIGFGGQGRCRWHYGVANAVLAGLEDEFVKKDGRGWLQHDILATQNLVRPSRSPGIYFFDFRELWHVASSGIVVVGTIFGAFILNYFTPPKGLGCRSGGYAIFCGLATLNFLAEMAVWWWTSNHTSDEFAQQEKWKRWVFIPADIFTSVFLLCIVIAQSAGLYNNCWCLSWEGWFDFATARSWTGPNVQRHWIEALALTLAIMLVSFAFIISEWCTQSHMSTHNYDKAMSGLKKTRRFKWLTSPVREVADFAITAFKLLIGKKRKSLVWKKGLGGALNETC